MNTNFDIELIPREGSRGTPGVKQEIKAVADVSLFSRLRCGLSLLFKHERETATELSAGVPSESKELVIRNLRKAISLSETAFTKWLQNCEKWNHEIGIVGFRALIDSLQSLDEIVCKLQIDETSQIPLLITYAKTNFDMGVELLKNDRVLESPLHYQSTTFYYCLVNLGLGEIKNVERILMDWALNLNVWEKKTNSQNHWERYKNEFSLQGFYIFFRKEEND